MQSYPHLNGLEDVDDTLFPQFTYAIKCMYDLLAMRQGIDPDRPAEESAGNSGRTRKVSGPEAIAALRELSQIKEKAKKRT